MFVSDSRCAREPAEAELLWPVRQGIQLIVSLLFGTPVADDIHSARIYLVFDVPSVLDKGIESVCDALHFEKFTSKAGC